MPSVAAVRRIELTRRERLDGLDLRPGQARTVDVTIDPRSAAHPLSFWDTRAGRWRTASGTYGVHVGPSAGDLPLRGAFRVR